MRMETAGVEVGVGVEACKCTYFAINGAIHREHFLIQ